MILMYFCCHLSRRGVNRNKPVLVSNIVTYVTSRAEVGIETSQKKDWLTEHNRLSRRGGNGNWHALATTEKDTPIASHTEAGMETIALCAHVSYDIYRLSRRGGNRNAAADPLPHGFPSHRLSRRGENENWYPVEFHKTNNKTIWIITCNTLIVMLHYSYHLSKRGVNRNFLSWDCAKGIHAPLYPEASVEKYFLS